MQSVRRLIFNASASIYMPPSKLKSFDVNLIEGEMKLRYNALIESCDSIALVVDAEYAFQALVAYNLSKLSRGYNEVEHGEISSLVELSAFRLYPFFGKGVSRDHHLIQNIIENITEQNKLRSLVSALGVDRTDMDLARLKVLVRLYSEKVRGSSYPPQIRRRIENIQGPFEEWFKAKVGIGPLVALNIIEVFQRLLNENFLTKKEAYLKLNHKIAELAQAINFSEVDASGLIQAKCEKEFSLFLEEMPLGHAVSYSQMQSLMTDLSYSEWDALSKLLGLRAESRSHISDLHEVKDRPIYYLSDDKMILVDVSSVYDAMFDAFDRVTRLDSPFRDRLYTSNLSQWMEEEVSIFCRRLFPENAVFKQVTYNDPDIPGGEAELDVAIAWGPFIILIEVKGKQFRTRSRLGDTVRLRDDLRASIEDSFEQAQRATRFIKSKDEATFVEKGTGRKMSIRREASLRIFHISVTLHHFAGLTTQLGVLKKIGLFKESLYPWSVSLGDLDVITRFAGSPEVFLHYIQRRQELQHNEKRIIGMELDIFGLYLENRLHPSCYWEQKTENGEDFSLVALNGGAEIFDEWFLAEQGAGNVRPNISLKLPPIFLSIITELRKRDDFEARCITFYLLNLSPDAIATIESEYQNIRIQTVSGNQSMRLTVGDDDLVVTLFATIGLSKEDLYMHTIYRAEIEKYRRKALRSVAIGIDVSDRLQLFDSVVWVEGAWEQNPILDTMIEDERPKLLYGEKIPGRNEICICGSGRKFKKCCIGKVSILRK